MSEDLSTSDSAVADATDARTEAEAEKKDLASLSDEEFVVSDSSNELDSSRPNTPELSMCYVCDSQTPHYDDVCQLCVKRYHCLNSTDVTSSGTSAFGTPPAARTQLHATALYGLIQSSPTVTDSTFVPSGAPQISSSSIHLTNTESSVSHKQTDLFAFFSKK